jgi:hypothetical protein
MKPAQLVLYLFFLYSSACAQRLHIGVMAGLASYNGDIVSKPFPGHKQSKEAFGFTLNYEITDRLMLRGGFTYGHVAGADSLEKDLTFKLRNLSFQTGISECSVMGEYYLFNLNETSFSPYGFAGIAVYHFNPYAFDLNGNKIFLQPLSTEGQGINGYTAKPYALTQLAIPFGGGLKFALNDNWRVGIEVGIRKLFTDYMDDVSTVYADKNDLLNAKGQRAVEMAYRGGEIPNGNPNYPVKGLQRGSEKSKDWYYFSGIHLTFRIGNGGTGGNRKNGCPAMN